MLRLRLSPQRADLLAALQEVQAKPQDLAKLTQLQETQTLGRKKFMASDYTFINNNQEEEEESQEAGRVPSAVRGGKRKKRKRPPREEGEDEEAEEDEEQQQQSDPTVVRLGVRKMWFCDALIMRQCLFFMCSVLLKA